MKVNGTQIRKQKGTGDIVYLRGTNAGGWLVQENWMNPTNASDQKTMMTTLANRLEHQREMSWFQHMKIIIGQHRILIIVQKWE